MPIKKKKMFTFAFNGNTYIVYTDHWATIDRVWISEKHLFKSGTKVTVSDETGNSKTFIKE